MQLSIIILNYNVRYFLETCILSVQKAIETNKQKMTLEQESLRASIDPHFIFNCLNNMLSLVYDKDFQSLKAFLPQLARLIRTSLQLGKETFISIETEKNYLTDYLTLEKMRFENKFDYAVVIDNTVDKNQLILPPLRRRENKMRHGYVVQWRGICDCLQS